MTYFKDANTLEELRKQYKELLKKYHPDNPQGSTEATQDINAEYDKLFRLLKDKHESNAEQTKNKTSYDDMKYNFEEDEKLREVLQNIIHLSDITIEVCGSWIWVSGNTYPHKEELKQYNIPFSELNAEALKNTEQTHPACITQSEKQGQESFINGRYKKLLWQYRSTDRSNKKN